VLKALARDPAQRFSTARELARALERTLPSGTSAADVAEWLERLFPEGVMPARADDPEMSGLQVPSRVLARLKEAEAPETSSSRRVVLVASALSVVLGLAGFAAWRMQPEEPKVLAPVAAPLPIEVPTPNDTLGEPLDDVAPSEAIGAPDTPSEAAATETDASMENPPRRVRPRNRRRLPRITTQPLAATPATPSATGEVRLSGPSELWGARVMVRGRQVAIVPGSVELPAGAHELRIERPSGPPIVRRVTVREGAVERVVVRP
jgi:hypothetical protein